MSNEQPSTSETSPTLPQPASNNMTIDVRRESITINGTTFTTCPTLAALETAIGSSPSEVREPKDSADSRSFFWHQLGIKVSGAQDVIEKVVLRLASDDAWHFSENPLDKGLFPNSHFAGKWFAAGEEIWDKKHRCKIDKSAFFALVGAQENPNFRAVYQTGYSAICRRQGQSCLLFRYSDDIYKSFSSMYATPALIEFIFPPSELPKRGQTRLNGKPLSVEMDGSSIRINGHTFVTAPSLRDLAAAVGADPRIEEAATASCDYDEFEREDDEHYTHRRTSWVWDDLGVAAHEITTTRLGKKQGDGTVSKDEEIQSQRFFDVHLIQGKAVIPPVSIWSLHYPTPETLDGLQFGGCKSLYDAELRLWGGLVDYSTTLREVENWKPGFRFEQQKWTDQVYPSPYSDMREDYKSYVRYTNGVSRSGLDVRGTEVCIHCHSFGRIGAVRFCFAPVEPKDLAVEWGFKVGRGESVIAAAFKAKWDSNCLGWVITNERMWLAPHLGSPLEFGLKEIRWVSIECRDGNRPPRQYSRDAIGNIELVIYMQDKVEHRIRLIAGDRYQTLDINVLILELRIAEVLGASGEQSFRTTLSQTRVMTASSAALPTVVDSGDVTIVEREERLQATNDVWKRDAIQCVTCGRHLSPLADKCSVCDAPVAKRHRSIGDLNWRMKTCSNCPNEMSRFAEKCQSCGHPNTELKQQRVLASLATTGCLVWLIFDLFTMGGHNFGIALLGLIASFMWGKAVGIAMWWYGHKSD